MLPSIRDANMEGGTYEDAITFSWEYSLRLRP